MIGAVMPVQYELLELAHTYSSETAISTHGGVEWYHALRRLQAAISLGMQLQRPARPDLKARGMGLEGYSLNHAQPRLCQSSFVSARVGRTQLGCKNATNTAQGQGLRHTPPQPGQPLLPQGLALSPLGPPQ